MKDETTYDAIVIGSGMTGGWAAKELTEKGLKTLVLEAGRPIVPEQDYVEHVPPWEMRFRGMRDRRRQMEDQPIQSTCYACDEWSAKFFVSDKEHPYTTAPGKPFRWIRGRQVGGRSIVWGRQVYRWSDLDFEANLRDGIAIDWPIRYADIAPWYDYVEDFIGITGEALGLAQLPDSKFLPPMQLNCAELVVKDAVAKHFCTRSGLDHWPCRRSHRGPSRSRRLTLLRSLRTRMHHELVLQQCECDSARRRENRTDDAAALQRGAQRRFRCSHTSCDWSASHRRPDPQFRGVSCPGHFPVRVRPGIGTHPAELFHARISQRIDELER